MNFRRLSPVEDKTLLREAYLWDQDRPQWYRDMDAVYGPDNFQAYIEAAKGIRRIDVGVFDASLIGVFILSERQPSVFDVHVMAKRGASNEILADAAHQIRWQLFAQGAQSISGWIASRNKPLLALANMVGFIRTSLAMLKGTYRGRVINWVQVVSTREQWLSEQT